MTLEFNVKELNYTKEQGGGSITPEGTKVITENGLYNVTTFAKASVNVEGTTPTGTTTITENGTYDVTEYASASVNVEGTEPTLITKTITVNGSYAATSDNADGYSVVSVNVSGSSPTLVTKTITENGNYNASSDNADGYSSVSVNVEPTIEALNVSPMIVPQTFTALTGTDGFSPVNISAVTSDIDSNISAGNIKSGVSILGVQGTVTELVGETKTITANGTYTPQTGNGFTSVSVNVSGTTPTGTYSITSNGTYDVTNYAEAEVNVSGGGGSQVVRGNWIVPQQYITIDEVTGDTTTSEYQIVKNYADSNNDVVTVVGFTVYNGYYTFTWDPPTGVQEAVDRPAIIKISDGRVYYASYLGQETDSYNTQQTITIDNSNSDIEIYFYNVTTNGITGFWSGAAVGTWSKGTLKSVTLARFMKYFAINGTIKTIKDNYTLACTNAQSFNILQNSVIPKNTAVATRIWNANRSSVSNYSLAKYYPPITEWASSNQIADIATNTFSSNRGLPPMPDGLDLSNVTGDIQFGYANTVEEELFVNTNYRMYCKIPSQNVTFVRNFTISNDNWQYIATNAPSVVNKTLSVGTENISIMGGSSGTIIQTLVNKGWTVN